MVEVGSSNLPSPTKQLLLQQKVSHHGDLRVKYPLLAGFFVLGCGAQMRSHWLA